MLRVPWRSATNLRVTIQTGQGGGAREAGADQSWDAVRADDSIQYGTIDVTEPAPREPGWFDAFLRWLGDVLEPVGQLFGAAWPLVKIALIVMAVLLVLLLLYRLLAPLLEPRVVKEGDAPAEWVPARDEALALLSDADQLAQAGRFDEATHMLLQRSVAQIGSAQPGWVEPSSTARELAMLTALPDAARSAFAVIAERVERSLFALRPLARSDWDAARSAYAEFALQKLTGKGRSR